MRSLRLTFFVCVSVLFLAAVSGVDLVYADDAVSASSAAAVVPGDTAGAVGDAATVEPSAVQKILDVLPDWIQIASLLITAFAAIAALTPTPKDDGVLLLLRKIVDFLALNFGGARNANRSKNSGDLR